MTTPRTEFLAGIRAETPILFGTIPFGLIFGVLAVSAGVPRAVGLAMSSVVFAGSAQFIGVELIRGGTPAALLIMTTFIVNLRHMLYSASVAPHIQHLSWRWKWLLAYLLTDEAYAVTILHYDRDTDPSHKHWFFLGAGLALWSTWQASTAVGIFLGAAVPERWSLDFTLVVTFIAIVVPALRDRAGVASALSAGLVAVLAAGLPFKLGLMLAALIGIGIGVLVENRRGAASRAARHPPHITP